MEDAHVSVIGMPGAPECSFFGVFDGHGGSLVALQTADKLVNKIAQRPEFKQVKTGAIGVENMQKAMKEACFELDEELRGLPAVASGEDHSGSTAVFAMITPSHIIVGNVGDSRCVMCEDRKTIPMSFDHKPTNPPEEARILAAGGLVTVERVNGDLAVSRALGDFSFKTRRDLPDHAQQVSCEPEFQSHERSANDQYLVLCCDGIWDVMTNEDVNDFYLKKGKENVDLKTSCCNLLDLCLEKKSRDNMTALAVRLNKF